MPAESEGDLLPDRREPGDDRKLAVPGNLQGAGQEVLLLTDPIDEFIVPSLHGIQGQETQGGGQGEVDGAASRRGRGRSVFPPLLDFHQEEADGKSKESPPIPTGSRRVRPVSSRMSGPTGRDLERLMQDGHRPKRRAAALQGILELNPEHPAVEARQKAARQGRPEPPSGELLPAAL